VTVIVAHAPRNDETIIEGLGTADYSYYFVLKTFRRVLETLGTLVVIDERAETDSDGLKERVYDAGGQVDAISELCRQVGEPCMFLSFTPPHETLVGRTCPMIPVFAWEYHDISCESWDGEPRHNWQFVLRTLGCAITHSNFAAGVVRKAMGDDFPVVSIPAPVWDRFAALDDGAHGRPDRARRQVAISGNVLDTGSNTRTGRALQARQTFDVNLDAPSGPAKPAPTAAKTTATGSLSLEGVVYTAVLNGRDGRKNWHEIVRCFCLALADREDATLVLKLIAPVCGGFPKIAAELARLRPFRCRVAVIDGFLKDDDYVRLAQASTYAVNASLGEGQCLPLMEYMSCGVPAIAPDHTGMADYIDDTNAFLVPSSIEPCAFPQDTREMYRTFRHRPDTGSLMGAFRESYRVVREDPERYRSMSRHAVERLRLHCSEEVVRERLKRFLEERMRASGFPGFTFSPHGACQPEAEPGDTQ
jgi:glycosyltransferase involved in cell wall biosynthesis